MDRGDIRTMNIGGMEVQNFLLNHYDELTSDTYWLEKNQEYKIEDSFTKEFESPSVYPAFKWREIYVIKSLTLWLCVKIREHVKKENDEYARGRKYSVVIGGFSSNIPIPHNHWEDPMKSKFGYWCYGDSFYIGGKYKYEFEYDEDENDYPRDGVTNSFLMKRFHGLDEAKVFAEKWMSKLVSDHAHIFEVERKMLKFIQEQQDKGVD